MAQAGTTTQRKTRSKRAQSSAVAYPPKLPDSSQLIFDEDEPLESDWHVVQIFLLQNVVNQHFAGRTDFFCGGNMFIYYSLEQVESVRKGRTTYKGPDFFVVKNVDGLKPRSGWVVWEEGGRYPDVIVELVSPTTQKKDKEDNLRFYAETFGTEEYFWYDPDHDELRGYRLVGGVYQPIEPNEQGWLWSEQLGAYIGTWDGIYWRRNRRWVRLYREDGSLIPTSEERAERLAQRLRELGVDPEEIL